MTPQRDGSDPQGARGAAPGDAPTPADDLPPGYQFHAEFELTPRAAAEALAAGDPGFLLVDVREPFELDAVSLPGTLHLPMGELEDRLDELIEHAEDHAERREGDADVAFLCHVGIRSRQAALYARAMGLSTAWSVAGGIDWWAVSVDPSLRRY